MTAVSGGGVEEEEISDVGGQARRRGGEEAADASLAEKWQEGPNLRGAKFTTYQKRSQSAQWPNAGPELTNTSR